MNIKQRQQKTEHWPSVFPFLSMWTRPEFSISTMVFMCLEMSSLSTTLTMGSSVDLSRQCITRSISSLILASTFFMYTLALFSARNFWLSIWRGEKRDTYELWTTESFPKVFKWQLTLKKIIWPIKYLDHKAIGDTGSFWQIDIRDKTSLMLTTCEKHLLQTMSAYWEVSAY